MSESLKFYHWTVCSFLIISIHRAQQPRSGWPSNVFQRFGRRWIINTHWSRDLAHLSVIFTEY